jgi:hypothetical protein
MPIAERNSWCAIAVPPAPRSAHLKMKAMRGFGSFNSGEQNRANEGDHGNVNKS